MPRYDYRCTTCEAVYELSRSMAAADEPASCPAGHQGAVRLLPVFAATGIGGSPAPAPAASTGGGGCCGGGCCS